MGSLNELQDYSWRAKYYQVEEEDLGDLAYHSRWLLEATGPVLVVPAGAGRLVPLVRSRANLFFCDREPAMVELVRRRLSSEEFSGHFCFQGDMFALPTHVLYDAIVVPSEAVQMFGPELLPSLLAGLCAGLAGRGSLVLDLAVFDPKRCDALEAPRYFRPDLWRHAEWIQWRREASDGSWVTRHVTHHDKGTHIDFIFTYTIELPEGPMLLRQTKFSLWRYDWSWIADLANKCGLELVRCDNSYSIPCQSTGVRLILTMQKAKLR